MLLTGCPELFLLLRISRQRKLLDIGETLYSVEPSQNVSGCSVPPGGPQGQLADSTYNVLSHESIETSTDPDGTAW